MGPECPDAGAQVRLVHGDRGQLDAKVIPFDRPHEIPAIELRRTLGAGSPRRADQGHGPMVHHRSNPGKFSAV